MTLATPTSTGAGVVRLATAADHDAIHRLNYRTFVEEIPQYDPHPSRRLVDRFHDENCYVVYEVDGAIVGMVAARTNRPFSLDQKLGDVEQFLPPHARAVEFRLLAVDRQFRSGKVFTSLVAFLAEYHAKRGYDLAIISGTTRQLKLYRHLGYVPFGPLVGRESAWYQPMYITLDRLGSWSRALRTRQPANFLPGPVSVSPAVRRAFAEPSISHRSNDYRELYRRTSGALCQLTGAKHATMLSGSGTLANDVVAAQIHERGGKGLVLVNGEFGERLLDHASRWSLQFEVMREERGNAFAAEKIAVALEDGSYNWLWMAHCETSTGVLNDIASISDIAARHQIALAVDAISSIGSVPVDLSAVWMASTTSGKALGSYAGVAIVLHNAIVAPSASIPRYLDLGYAIANEGIPFTQLSNLVRALDVALTSRNWSSHYETLRADAMAFRTRLAEHQFHIVAKEDVASPAVHTIALPPQWNSQRVGNSLRALGWQVGFESEHLKARNWIQVCLMGEYPRNSIECFPAELRDACVASERPELE